MANVQSNGLGFGSVLFLIFLALKLTGNIAWSWWWVTSPLWIPFALIIFFLGVLFMAGVMGCLVVNKK